jgi:hypothetical protein
LKAHREWIGAKASAPDMWRFASEPFLKIDEDPNHGWFLEQSPLLQQPPRSRYEFVIALYEEHKKTKDPLTNVRWTGTLPYAIVEGYERMKAGVRIYRMLQSRKESTQPAEMEIAYAMGWLGHYAADGAMPLHVSIHHDGWQGANPKEYTTDPRVHGRYETAFVDMVKPTEKELAERSAKARQIGDVFAHVIAYLKGSNARVETVYVLDKQGAFTDKDHPEARKLLYGDLTRAVDLLRDLAYTAWLESAAGLDMRKMFGDPSMNPISPKHPKYNPATGSAPAQ